MNDPSRTDESRHNSIWLLLPWYANGSLADAERRDVEGHLDACARCRAELAQCRGLATALHGEQDPAPSPHPIQLARLMARIEASEHNLDAGGAGIDGAGSAATWRRSALAATPRPVRIALAGQLAALLLLGTALVLRLPGSARPAAGAPAAPVAAQAAAASAGDRAAGTPGASASAAGPAAGARPLFHTLSAPAAPAPAGQRRIRVVFSETATEKQIRDVLLQVRGRVIDGPSPLGTYTLEVPVGAAATPAAAGATGTAGTAAPGDTLGCVLAFLHAQRVVRFAEPIAGAAPGDP